METIKRRCEIAVTVEIGNLVIENCEKAISRLKNAWEFKETFANGVKYEFDIDEYNNNPAFRERMHDKEVACVMAFNQLGLKVRVNRTTYWGNYEISFDGNGMATIYCKTQDEALRVIRQLIEEGHSVRAINAHETFYGADWYSWLMKGTRDFAEFNGDGRKTVILTPKK